MTSEVIQFLLLTLLLLLLLLVVVVVVIVIVVVVVVVVWIALMLNFRRPNVTKMFPNVTWVP